MFTRIRSTCLVALETLALLTLSFGQASAEWFPNGNATGAAAWWGADPSVASDGSGGAFVAWGLGICAGIQHFDRSGEFAEGWPSAGLPTRACDGYAPVGDRHTRVVADGEGGAYITSTVWPVCVSCQADPMYVLVQRIDGDGQFAPGWPAGGVSALSQTWQRQLERNETPRVTPNGRYGVLLAWQYDFSRSGGIGTGPIAVQLLAPDGTRRWGDQGLLVCSASGYRSVPEIVADGLGGAFVFWCEQRPPDSLGRVYAQHVTASGALAWAPDGIAASERYRLRLVEKPQRVLVVAPPFAIDDGAHGAIVAWSGTRGTDLDVFATRVTYGGALPWRSDARVCTAPGNQFDARLVHAGRESGWDVRHRVESFRTPTAGCDVIVGWLDSRPDGVRVSAQRLARDGGIAWGPVGVEVGTAVIAAPDWAPRSLLAMASDGAGGAFFAWPDDRPEGGLFAVRLGPDGKPASGWPDGGAAIDGVDEALATADMADVGGGNAIVAWQNTGGASRVTMLGPRGPAATPVASRHLLALHEGAMPVPSGGAPPATRMTAGSLPALQSSPRAPDGRLQLSLSGGSPATLELFDVTGRKSWSREVGGLGAGEHDVRVGDGASLAPGIYMARVTQAGRWATARIVILH